MKSKAPARSFVALLLVVFLLCAPLPALAKKGEKNYKRGLQHEAAQQWEQAAQEFALAVAQSPSDTEYQLHYRRAIFNASQMYMQKGRVLAEQGDYVGAYNAFRQAYGYDPVNDLAAQEMERVLRLQREKEGLPADGRPTVSPTSYREGANGTGARVGTAGAAVAEDLQPEQLKSIQYSGELEPFIRRLTDELGLNVVFDQNFAQVRRNINVHWKNITAARALDYIFQSQGLFFQRLDRRTILVADQSKRPQYQQLVLRTFYLYNVKPEDARQLIQATLPANAGRQPTFAVNNNTNSITVRDTPENIRIIEKLLQGIDKDRSEVVMEVSIYEVSRSDLLQIGNQIGTTGAASTLGNLGGIQPSSVLIGGARQLANGSGVFPLSTGVGLLIPTSTLSALQSKTNTRLVFSTQVHAFDDEKSSTRVGSKVPVQTASVYTGITNNTGNNNGGAGAGNVFGLGNGFPVIQYEDVGLNLDFKPKIYPNQDVQVTMTIESKDQTAGPDPLTPIFTQRKIEGVARVPNGKTMMIASVAQDRESDGRTGLPLIGLVPILGRLFTAPRRDNSRSDVVITMTPRVLRAPNITPSDEQTRPAGSMQTPQAESLEAMLRETEREEQLARARALPTNQEVKISPQPTEEYSFVPAPKTLAEVAASNPEAATTAAPNTTAVANTTAAANTTASAVNVALKNDAGASVPAPVPAIEATKTTPVNAQAGTAAPSAALKSAADATPVVNNTVPSASTSAPASAVPVVNSAPANAAPATANPVAAAATTPAESSAELLLLPEQPELKVGERRRVMVFLKTNAPVGLAAAALRFNPKALAVRSVSHGVLTAEKSSAPVLTQSIDSERGVLVVSVSPAAGAAPLTGEGLLLIFEVEGLAPGDAALAFDSDKVHFIATDGRVVRPRFSANAFKITQ
jgi:general secretion pathway protein D